MINNISESITARPCFTVALFCVAGFLIVSLSACHKTSIAVKDFDAGKESAAKSDVKKGIKPQPDDQVAVISTADFCDTVIGLYPNEGPKNVERFKKLIHVGVYYSTAIHH